MDETLVPQVDDLVMVSAELLRQRSPREAARALGLKCADTVTGYFEELEQHGFIAVTRRGGFNMQTRLQGARQNDD